MSDTRLNKFLALHTGMSRREADDTIEQGRVRVGDESARIGQTVSATDDVTLDGQSVVRKRSYTYIMLNKPTGYVCSRRQQGDSPTIYTLLRTEYRALKPVGRLDRDSSGLILLTDDGDFAHRMTHPSYRKTKVYHARLDRPLEPLHQQMISDYGIQLEDGVSKFTIVRLDDSAPAAQPTALSSPASQPSHSEGSMLPIEPTQDKAVSEVGVPEEGDGRGDGGRQNTHTSPLYEITMSEGRNRQIRRTFAALGYTVTYLHRTQFGNCMLGSLGSGQTMVDIYI